VHCAIVSPEDSQTLTVLTVEVIEALDKASDCFSPSFAARSLDSLVEALGALETLEPLGGMVALVVETDWKFGEVFLN
jgi:hypothetical protein